MRNRELRVKAGRNILDIVKRRKIELIGYILHRNRLLKHSTGGKGKKEGKVRKKT